MIRGDCEPVRLVSVGVRFGPSPTTNNHAPQGARYGQKPTANNRAPQGERFGRK